LTNCTSAVIFAATLALLAALPVSVVYLVSQGYIVDGLTIGSVK
jgi:ABC-type maltose transport system permease subunit